MPTIRRFQRSNDTGSSFNHHRRRAVLAGGLALSALAVSSVAAAGRGQADLGEVRAATARFQRVEVAEAAGHELGWKDPKIPIDGCVFNQMDPAAGAMGYHWFNHDAIEDTTLDPLRPEGLVYERLPNGKLHLVAVEWIVPKVLWEASYGEGNIPTVLGQEMGVLNPVLNWYILHAWVWKPNPSGMFNNWNPDVTCP